ncbi:MAG: helix-turn-helix transcriptional regulator [Clostridiales bacterium]|nr:helix-turn-helix transcriptional regulator [Clostridiales bacterium]
MVPFADRLREARSKKGLMQKEVAEYLKMTPRAYQYYEGGRRRPDYETLVAIADYLEVTTDYLLGRTEEADEGDGV